MEQAIKRLLIGLGADDCGIAGVDRFAGAPTGFHPTDIYGDCRSVVVFVKRIPKGFEHVSPRICYTRNTDIVVAEVDRISYLASVQIEAMGANAVPVPCDTPYEFFDAETLTGRGILSMRHAAQKAGLGSLGKNTLLIHRAYGNRVTIGAILTNLDLASDPLCEDLCISGCRLCLDCCPTHALDGQSVNQSLCRPYTYTTNARGFDVCNCNTCRMVCPAIVR
jgi:epoxyqueuosine reductase QueG